MTFGKDARRHLSLGTLLCVAAIAPAQTDLQAIGTHVGTAQGVAMTPKVGDSTYLTVRFRVQGTPGPNFRVRFTTSFRTVHTSNLSFVQGAGEYYAVWGPMPIPVDAPFTVTAELDPDRRVRETNRRNNAVTVTVRPQAPDSALERFGFRLLEGGQQMSLRWGSGSGPERVRVALPMPTNGTLQEVVTRSADGFETEFSDPFDEPIWVREFLRPAGSIEARSEFRVWAGSVRVNRTALRDARFSEYNLQNPELAANLQPETYVESTHRDIRALAQRTLPSDFRTRLSPAEAAELLYRQVLRRMSYRLVPGQAPSALAALKRGRGDCGALSSLFVALSRASGIPARTVVGMHQDSFPWHVWAEFYDPRAGWVPVDPAFAEGLGANGDLPLYFGVIPEGNSRIALGHGFDRRVSEMTLAALQSPAVRWWGHGVRVEPLQMSGWVRQVAP